MPNKCCVPGCKSNYNNTGKYVTIFKFPLEEEGTMREKWLKVIPRKDCLPRKWNFICIKHFQPDDLQSPDSYTDNSGVEHFFPPRQYPGLKANAIPSIFPDLPETMVGNPSSHKKGYTNRFPTDKTRRLSCEHKVKRQHWKSTHACRLCKPVKHRKLQKTRICSKSASMSSTAASSSNHSYPSSKDMPKTSNGNKVSKVNIECEDSTRVKTQQESEANGCPDLCLEVEEEPQASEHSEDDSTEDDWESFNELSRVTKGVQYWPVRLSKVVGDDSDPNCDTGNEPMRNDQLPSIESQTEGGSNAEYEPSININIEVDSPEIGTHKVLDTVEHESVYATERMYTNAELFVPENVKQDVKKEAEDEGEVYDDHYITEDSSQLHKFADYQLQDESAFDYKTHNSHKDLYPVCLTSAANAPSEEFSAHGKNTKLSKSSSCKIQKVPNDQEQGLSSIREKMLIQEALTCQPVVSIKRLDTDAKLAQEYSRFQDNLNLIKQELSTVFDHNEQMNNSCLQPMNEAIAGNGSSWLMEDTIPSTFVNDSSFMVIRPENHLESFSGSRNENNLLTNSVGRKRGRPRKKPHGDIKCKTSAPQKRGRPRTKHLDDDRAVNANETRNEASNISPVNHPINPLSSDNLLGSCYNCSTQNESRYVSVEFQPRGIDRLIGESAGKLVACGSQAPNFVNVWSNRTPIEQPIKRRRGRPTLKSKSLERRANEPITVSILNCGHACSKCNSAQTTKWLEEHDYAANPPLSFSINDDQRQFEEESSSNSALVFQKLCEINQLLNGKSQFHFDPKTGVLKFKTEALNEPTGANLTPFSQILQGVDDKPTQQPPVSLASPAQPTIFVMPPLQPTVMPFSSAQTFLIPCSSQSIDLPLDNFIVSNTHLEVIP